MTDYLTSDGLLWARTKVLLQISSIMAKVIHGELDIEPGRDELRNHVAELFDLIDNVERNSE
jgi:hypothetical protein